MRLSIDLTLFTIEILISLTTISLGADVARGDLLRAHVIYLVFEDRCAVSVAAGCRAILELGRLSRGSCMLLSLCLRCIRDIN